MRRPHPTLPPIALVLLVYLVSGCASVLNHSNWPASRLTAPDYAILSQSISVHSGSLDLAKANVAYAQAIEAMELGKPECVDHFFHSAHFSWCEIQANIEKPGSNYLESAELYRSSLNALIVQGQHYQRLDPSVGLKVNSKSGPILIPCHFYGFPSEPEEIRSVVTVGDYSSSQLNNIYRQNGLGVPGVVQCRSSQNVYQRKQTSFDATIILRPEGGEGFSNSQAFALEFHNPLVTSSVSVNQVNVPLAYDKSAAIARALSTTKRNYVQAFLKPGNVDPDEEGLFMLEPYVEGKIPIVLVHGLLSDRLTWANLVNEIRARPWFSDRFQIWGFEYPTGKPFLPSAAMLRSQLSKLCCSIDPDDADPALKHIVLVGHSMGGLISKLQVSSSGNCLWEAAANRQFDQTKMPPRLREKFAESMFFEPVSRVKRVIYIGTPHRGSALAHRAIGRLGSLLIEQSEDVKLAHRKLIDDNPNTFSSEFTQRIPNSLDLLEPESPLLSAIGSLPTAPTVNTHSIIGRGRWMPGNGDSDGVVPISSARQLTADSEKFVGEKHADLTRDPLAIDEVLCILREHYQSFHGP